MKSPKPYKPKDPYAFARAALRNASMKWPAMAEAERRARVGRGRYQCNICGNKNLKRGDYARDHIRPVVEVNSEYADFNKYIPNLYCKPEDIQIICKIPCHEIKTAVEAGMRKFYRQARKLKKQK